MKSANGDMHEGEWVGDCMHGRGAFSSGRAEMSMEECGSHPNQDAARVILDGLGCGCLVVECLPIKTQPGSFWMGRDAVAR